MSAKLTVNRDSRIMELRRMPFEVAVDGTTVGSINSHGTFETSIEPGRHTLKVRAGRYSSKAESFSVGDGDAVNFRCNGARIWPIYIASIAVPGLALSLKPE